MPLQWNHKIFEVQKEGFDELALEIFQFQSQHCPVYKAYMEALSIHPSSIQSILQIPFLPISFFKSHTVQTTSFTPQAIFESSGTTGY